MLHIESLLDLYDIMTDAIADEDCVSFISDSEGVREMMRLICMNTDIVPDLITFNSEEDNYYYISLDKSEFDGISFSITEAVDSDGDFYGLQGLVFVDECVPSKYDRCIAENKYIKSDPIRITYEPEEYDDDEDCCGDCDNCPHHNVIDPELDFNKDGKLSGFKGSWNNGNTSFSYSFHSTNEDKVMSLLKKIL